MITRRLKTFQIMILWFAFCVGGMTSAFAATKNEAVALAGEVMQVTLDTRGISKTSKRSVNDNLIDIVMKRRTENLSDILKELDGHEKTYEHLDLFHKYSQLLVNSDKNFKAMEEYSVLERETDSKDWRRSYLSSVLLAQLNIDKSDILEALHYTRKSIEIVNAQTVTPETTSMMYDAHEVLQTAYIYERSCLLYTSPSPRDKRQSRMPSSA